MLTSQFVWLHFAFWVFFNQTNWLKSNLYYENELTLTKMNFSHEAIQIIMNCILKDFVFPCMLKSKHLLRSWFIFITKINIIYWFSIRWVEAKRIEWSIICQQSGNFDLMRSLKLHHIIWGGGSIHCIFLFNNFSLL